MRFLLGSMLVLLFTLVGCNTKTYFTMPTVNDVESVEYYEWALNPDNPKPLSPNNEHDKQIITKLIGFLGEAKIEGYVDKVATIGAPTDFAIIKMKDQSELTLTHLGDGVVYVYDSKTKKTTRIHSSPLDNWLAKEWAADLQKQK